MTSTFHFSRGAKIPIDGDFINDRSAGETSPDPGFDNRLTDFVRILRLTQLIPLIRENILNSVRRYLA